MRHLMMLACVLCAWRAQAADSDERLRAVLAGIHLPPGFAISLYARVPGARSLAVDPRSGTLLVGTREDHVYAVSGPGRAAVFAPDMALHDPNGVCFAPDGTLFVAEENRIFAFANGDAAPRVVVAQDGLIPVSEQGANHGARVCRIGPDDRLYVTIGQPYNVPPPAKQALYAQYGLGSITRMDRDGTHREIFAAGLRNSVGLDFDPRDGTLWFTDNQVDRMGDDIPPGELNHATRAGENFGFPWYGGGHVRTVEYRDQTPPADVVFPAVEMVAHAADLGLTFYRGTAFPAPYRGAIFSAQHGSWNRSVPVGARLMVTTFEGGVLHTQPFAEGWNTGSGRYLGRPVDVAELKDGSLVVSDDQEGAVYRITFPGS